jgi:RNA polymerase sigma factor for flagellar operon FliA
VERGVLTPSEIDELWLRWRSSGDTGVREQLICHYLPVVEFLAGRAARTVPDSHRPDIYSFGVLGLMDAVDKFRPEMGNRFETYGSRRIRGAMSDGIRSLNWLPRRASQAASRVIEKVIPVDFQTARTAVGARLEDSLPDPEGSQVFDGLLLEADHEEVIEAMASLPERERLVVREHYYRGRRLAEIGRDLGVTESRVCQLHRRALVLLRDTLTARLSA